MPLGFSLGFSWVLAPVPWEGNTLVHICCTVKSLFNSNSLISNYFDLLITLATSLLVHTFSLNSCLSSGLGSLWESRTSSSISSYGSCTEVILSASIFRCRLKCSSFISTKSMHFSDRIATLSNWTIALPSSVLASKIQLPPHSTDNT